MNFNRPTDLGEIWDLGQGMVPHYKLLRYFNFDLRRD